MRNKQLTVSSSMEENDCSSLESPEENALTICQRMFEQSIVVGSRAMQPRLLHSSRLASLPVGEACFAPTVIVESPTLNRKIPPVRCALGIKKYSALEVKALLEQPLH